MSKHRLRHSRAYAAGARAMGEAIKADLAPILPDDARPDLERVIDNIRTCRFPMPAAQADAVAKGQT